MGSKKSKTKNEPWAPAQPYILKGMAATNTVFDKNQPHLERMSNFLYGAADKMAPGAFGATPYIDNAQQRAQAISNGAFMGNNPGQTTYDRLQSQSEARLRPFAGGATTDPSTGLLRKMAIRSPAAEALAAGGSNPATGFASKVAGGGYLNAQPSAGLYSGMMDRSYSTSNPFLEDMIRQTGEDVRTNTNRMFASRGMGAGVSSAFADVMSRNLADSGNALRYQNYNDAENRRLQAAGQSDAVWSGERGRMDGATGLLSADHNAAQDRSLQAAQADAQQRLAAAQTLGSQYNATQDRLGRDQDRALEAARASDAARSDQVQQMLSALALTDELRNAEYAGVAPTLSVINSAADLPYIGVGALNGNIRTASNGYGVQTTKESGGLGSALGSAFSTTLGGNLANWFPKKG